MVLWSEEWKEIHDYRVRRQTAECMRSRTQGRHGQRSRAMDVRNETGSRVLTRAKPRLPSTACCETHGDYQDRTTGTDARQCFFLDLARMDPPPPNKKRSFSKFLSEQWNKGFRRPPSRLPSPSASQAPSPRSLSPSPLLDDQTSLLSRAGSSLGNEDQSVPRTSTQAPAPLPATGASYPALGDSENGPPIATIVVSSPATDSSNMNESLTHSTTPATVSVHPTGHQATSKVWAGLVTRLQALNISKRMPLPLQSAIGAFIPCLDILEVGGFIAGV